MNISCAILAGGLSRRMGCDKATLMICGRPLISLVYDKVKTFSDDVFIISSYHEKIDEVDAPIYRDVLPANSPVVGIASALLHARHQYTLVVACDMPFLSSEAIEFMLEAVNGEDIIIPKTRMGYEPLHAIYNKSCLSHFLKCAEREILKIRDAFPFLFIRELDANYFLSQGRSVFTNINTREDLEMIDLS